MTQFAVTVPGPDGYPYVIGPFDDANVAADYCQFVTDEIDPARVVILRDPAAELLAWRKVHPEKHNLTG